MHILKSLFTGASRAMSKPITRNLTPADVNALLQRGEIVLVDVREPDEHAGERIHGALNAPLSTFDPATLPEGATIVLHCVAGKRSEMALERCRVAGVAVDAHLAGGLKAWIDEGLPTVRAGAPAGDA